MESCPGTSMRSDAGVTQPLNRFPTDVERKERPPTSILLSQWPCIGKHLQSSAHTHLIGRVPGGPDVPNMHVGLPIAAPARAVRSASPLPRNSIPGSPSRTVPGSPAQLQPMQDISSQASIDLTRSLFDYPRASFASRRALLNYPRPSDHHVGINPTNRSATIPWDVLYHFLCIEVGEWFWDQGMDPEHVLDKYHDDGTIKETEEVTKQTWWQQWLAKRNRSAKTWQKRWKKSHALTKFQYDGVRLDELLIFLIKSQREQYRSNPYNLSSSYYLLIFLCLAAWAIGSVVCGHYEAQAKIQAGDRGALTTLCRGMIGAIPAVTQITLFLFPPLLAAD